MSTFVISHGAWDGGWYWKDVASHLRNKNHEVYTPTLTGLGEREHLGTPNTDLNTHIQDIVNVCVYEDLHDVVLIGHSYSGAVITGVAGRIPERLSELIYLDAFVLENGQSMVDQFPDPKLIEQLTGLAQQFGEGWRIPFTATPDSDPRHVPQPLQTFYQKLTIENPDAWNILKKSYIACTNRGENPVYRPIQLSANKALADGWSYYELPTGHNANESMPVELAQLLDEIPRKKMGQ